MKLFSILVDQDPVVAVLLPDEDHIVDLTRAGHLDGGDAANWFSSMQAFIEAGPAALECARQFFTDPPANCVMSRSTATLLAPLPVPAQIRCFSVFEEHARRSAQVMMKIMAANSPTPAETLQEFRSSGRFNIPTVFYERPLYYKANRFSVTGPDSDIEWPAYSDSIDYELEIAAVIGRRGKDIRRQSAHEHIFGYSIFNDLTARDEQSREMVAPLGPAKGKDFDGGNVLGPCIVTVDELANPAGVRMTAKVNGEMWTDTRCEGMAHTFADMLAYVSRSETIYPGEIFLSGCVGGGCGMEQERYLERGDVVELEVEGIGTLRNRIA